MSNQLPISAKGLTIGYRGEKGKQVLVGDQLQLSLHSGELVCLLGPNGSGKSTLLRTLAGLIRPLGGNIRIDGSPLEDYTVKALARKISVVLTEPIHISHLNVRTLVTLGRSPYTGWLGRGSEEDKQKVEEALEKTGIQHLAERMVDELSDGERQKVMIARTMAQDTPLVLLDEPTAHLDLPNRVEILRTLRELAAQEGKAILLSTHELDLALKAADKVWLMDKGTGMETGVPEDLVLNGTLERIFQGPGFELDKRTGTFRVLVPHGKDTITLGGDELGVFWTERALERNGLVVDVVPAKEAELMVVKKMGESFQWEFKGEVFESLEEFLKKRV